MPPFVSSSLFCFLSLVFTLSAQASTVIVENSGLTIPLQSGQIASLTPTGALEAHCTLTPSGSCEGLPQGAPAEASLSVSEDQVALGAPVHVTWSPTQDAEFCVASSSTGIGGWSGPVNPSGGTKSVTTLSEGTATLGLKCFNVSGSAGSFTVTVIVGTASGPGDGGCSIVKEEIIDPFQRSLFQPEGFTRIEMRWNQFCGPGSVYPICALSEPYPVGSFTYSGNQYSPAVTTRGKYMVIPFVGNDQNWQFSWIQAKPVSIYGYQPSRPTDAKYVVISTCPGDFRVAGDFQHVSPDPVNDPTFKKQCRNHGVTETGIYYGPTQGGGRCPVLSGRIYYLNIVHANALDGLSPFETGCRDQSMGLCETSWRLLTD